MKLKEQTYYLTANGGITYITDSQIYEVYVTATDKEEKLSFNDYNGRKYRPDGRIDRLNETIFDLIAEVPRELLFKVVSTVSDYHK